MKLWGGLGGFSQTVELKFFLVLSNGFLTISTTFHSLFAALNSTVSECSGADCGQIWGQKRFLTRGGRCLLIPAGKRFLCARLLEFQQLLSGIYCRPLIPNLWIIIRFSAAHPAGAVDLPLGKSSGGATRPCRDKLFASKLAEDSLLAMDRAHALFYGSNCDFCSIVLTP